MLFDNSALVGGGVWLGRERIVSRGVVRMDVWVLINKINKYVRHALN